MTHIAFICLGNMGGPMAANLVKAGHMVNGFDLSATALEHFAAAGGRPADSVAHAIDGAEVIISMLPAGQHVESLYLGADGLFARLPAGTLVIDCSTIAAHTARGVAEAAAGAGQTAKVCNNMLLGILMAGTAEALALGVQNGLDPAVLSQIMGNSSGSNWVLDRYNPWPGVMDSAPASRGYSGGFMSELMLKDLRLASETASQSQAANPMGSQAQQLFEQHVAAGNGKLDFSSIVQHFQQH